MRTIIAGSRTLVNQKLVGVAVKLSGLAISEVVSGCARGADKMGEAWAAENGIPVKLFPADWDGLGKRAGFVRNEAMAEYAEALIALWDGESRGTKHMIESATGRGLRVFVMRLPPAPPGTL